MNITEAMLLEEVGVGSNFHFLHMLFPFMVFGYPSPRKHIFHYEYHSNKDGDEDGDESWTV
jgi:hypothetical protein